MAQLDRNGLTKVGRTFESMQVVQVGCDYSISPTSSAAWGSHGALVLHSGISASNFDQITAGSSAASVFNGRKGNAIAALMGASGTGPISAEQIELLFGKEGINFEDIESHLDAQFHTDADPPPEPPMSDSDAVHVILDVAGMIPGIGNAADLVNAGIYVLEGNYTEAALSIGAAIPIIGQAVTSAKYATRVAKMAKVADEARDIIKGLDRTNDARKFANRADDLHDASRLLGDAKGAGKNLICEVGEGACFVAGTPVVRDLVSTQTAAVWAEQPEEEMSSVDRSYTWALAVGTIAVGLCVGLRKKEEDEAENSQEAASQLFDELGQDDLENDLDLSEPWDTIPAPEQSAEAIDSLCEQLFHGQKTFNAPWVTSRPVRKLTRIGTCTLDRPQQTKTIKRVSRPEPIMDTKSTKTSPKPLRLRQIIALSLILLGSFFGYRAFSTPVPTPHRHVVPATPPKECVTSDIEDIRVGETLPAIANPEGEHDTQFGESVEPEQWRKLTLLAPKRDGSVSDVTLLRPISWLEEQNAFAGGEVWIEVPECGISGLAKLVKIEPCPEISGEGQVVTGTFRHHVKSILNIYIEGEPGPIGATPNHPFWLEDAQKFVRADELLPGDRLQTIDGTLQEVEAIVPRPGDSHTVYNLEVQCSHVYNVGQTGLLVHNGTSCRDIALGLDVPGGGYKTLSEQVGASRWQNWARDGITRRSVTNKFGRAFHQAAERARNIHFTLDGIDDAADAVKAGKKGFIPGNMTNAELEYISRNPELLKKTFFYQNGTQIPCPF